MNGYDLLDALYLDDDGLVDNEVRPVDSLYGMTFIHDRNRRLPGHRETTSLKLDMKTFLVYGFKQSWSELSVNLDGSANHSPGKVIRFGMTECHR